jgi:hypothetical protein
MFCPCCGMALRVSPTNQRDKERLRQLQLKREEQDKIIRIMKGTKKYPVNQGKVKIKYFTTIGQILAIIHDEISASAGLHRWLS